MKVQGTTQVEVDINLLFILEKIYKSKTRGETLIKKDGKFYLDSSRHIENRGWDINLSEISKERYDTLKALELVIKNFKLLE
jgi:hypothetical protein